MASLRSLTRDWLAPRLASVLPSGWQFRVTGLPLLPKSTPQPLAGEQAPAVVSVPGGIATHLGPCLSPRGELLAHSTYDDLPSLRQRFLKRQRYFPRVPRRKGTVATLLCSAQTNYFHWMFEAFPRWKSFLESGQTFDWLYTCHKQPFQREAWQILGVDAQKIIDSGQQPMVQADLLLVPRAHSNKAPWIMEWLRTTLLPVIEQVDTKTFPRRLYISRRKATSRGIANELALLDLLKTYGFQEVFLEDWSWREQMALFLHAETILGPHGAGFTNLVFTPRQTPVLELRSLGDPSDLYEMISQQLGMNYQLISCPPLSRDLRSSQMQAPLGEVTGWLNKTLGS